MQLCNFLQDLSLKATLHKYYTYKSEKADNRLIHVRLQLVIDSHQGKMV